MKNVAMLAVALAAIGCGGSDGAPSPAVPHGNWLSSISATCLRGLNFTEPGRFTYRIACVGGDGAGDVEHEAGTFALTYDTIIFTPTEASCPAPSLTGAARLAFDATTLSLSDSSATIVFEPNTAAGSGAGTFGCFGMGSFMPAPIHPL